MPYFAVVKFVEQDKSRQIVLSTDIKDFKPIHADAIDDKVYDIQWQDLSKSFDGYFRGNVILLAGTLVVIIILTLVNHTKCRSCSLFEVICSLVPHQPLGTDLSSASFIAFLYSAITLFVITFYFPGPRIFF